MTDRLSAPALDDAGTAGGVAQLTGNLTAAALYIADIATVLTSSQLTDAQMQ